MEVGGIGGETAHLVGVFDGVVGASALEVGQVLFHLVGRGHAIEVGSGVLQAGGQAVLVGIHQQHGQFQGHELHAGGRFASGRRVNVLVKRLELAVDGKAAGDGYVVGDLGHG